MRSKRVFFVVFLCLTGFFSVSHSAEATSYGLPQSVNSTLSELRSVTYDFVDTIGLAIVVLHDGARASNPIPFFLSIGNSTSNILAHSFVAINVGVIHAGTNFFNEAESVAEKLEEGLAVLADAFITTSTLTNTVAYDFGRSLGAGFTHIGRVPHFIFDTGLATYTRSVVFLETMHVPPLYAGSKTYITHARIWLRDYGASFKLRPTSDIAITKRASAPVVDIDLSAQLAAVNSVDGITLFVDRAIVSVQSWFRKLFPEESNTPVFEENSTPSQSPIVEEIKSPLQPQIVGATPTYVDRSQIIYTGGGISAFELAVAINGLRSELQPRIELAMQRPRSNSNSPRSSDDDDVDLSGYLALTGGTLTGALGGTDATFSDDLTAATLVITGSTTLNGVEYLFPSTDGTDNYVLTTDGNGALTWEAAAAGGITSLGGLSGASQTFASSSDTNIGITIVSSGTTHTLTPSWIGTLAAGRGGTGTSTVNANELLIGNAGGTAWTTIATSSLGIVSDHGGLTGLSDDDHTQYALLAGRSGGQTLVGGTGASESLTFNSTSHGTKGRFKFVGSGVNGSLSITDSSGAAQFNFFSDDSGNNGAKIRANQFVATNGTFFLAEDFATFRMSSAGSITFASGVSATDNAADIGLARSAAGILRVSDGGTGGGALLANYFSATSTTATSTFAGVLHPTGIFADTSGSGGVSGQLLQSTGTGLSWVATTSLGFGNVVGPASATDNAIARFDLTTGKIIQNSGITIEDTNRVGLASNVFISGEGNNFQTFSDSSATGYASMRTGDSRFHLYSTTGTVRFALLPSTDQFQIGNNSAITWSANATDPGTGIDVGLVRDSAGVLRISDGATGGGALLANYFTATSTTATSTFAGGLSVAGSGGLNVLQNGRVGIGNAAPIASLSVGSSNAFISLANSDVSSGSWIRNDGSNTVFSANNGSMFIGFSGDTGKTIHIGNANPGVLQVVGSAPVSSLVVASSGKVGMSTTTPGYTLTVAGDAMLTGALYDNTYSAGSSGMVLQSTGTGLSWVATSSLGISGGSSEWTDGGVFDYDLEEVYVGTSTQVAERPLFFVGTSTAAFSIASTTGNTILGSDRQLWMEKTGDVTWKVRNAGSTRLIFNGVFDRFLIDGNTGGSTVASGGFYSWSDNGFDLTTPDTFLFRDGTAGVLGVRSGGTNHGLRLYGTGNTSDYERLGLNTSATNNYVQLAAETAGTGDDNLSILLTPAGTGNVGIATTTPGYKLTVTGTVAFDGLTTGSGDAVCIDTVTKEIQYNSGADTCLASSIRFKHDVKNLALGLSDLRELRAVSYKENATGEERIGFIAEEVEDVDNRLMFYEQDGDTPRGVRYEDIVALVVKSVQELADRLDAIEAQLAAAGQGVGNFIDLIVEKITADEVQTEKLCIGETCVTETQLKDLLDDADVETSVDEPEDPPVEEEEPPVESEEPSVEPEDPPAEDSEEEESPVVDEPIPESPEETPIE